MISKKFGRWTVFEQAKERDNKRHIMWVCKCDCGTIRKVQGSNLRASLSRSCGCISEEANRKRLATHGMGSTNIYKIWKGMKSRCYNPNNDSYKYYGGRGIKVCNRWFESFENFLADMGMPAEEMSIDRIDGDGDYDPSNCKWATHKEQMRNTTSNRMITFNGESKLLTDWADKLNMGSSGLRYRLKNWPLEKALTQEVAIK